MRSIIDDEGTSIGGVIAPRGVTRKFASEDEMIANDPSHSINVLPGGIAHHFNNLLAAILGNISVARVNVDSNNDLDQKLFSAEKAAMQARSFSQQLLTFSKGGTPLPKVTTSGELVRESAQFVLRGSKVKCEVSEPSGLWSVEANRGQINQVVRNLTINADQAMPARGVIKITSSNERVGKDEIANLEPGAYVRISFTDTGVGIEHITWPVSSTPTSPPSTAEMGSPLHTRSLSVTGARSR